MGTVLVLSDAAKPTAQTKPLRMVFASDMVQRPSAAIMKGVIIKLSRQGFASGMVPARLKRRCNNHLLLLAN